MTAVPAEGLPARVALDDLRVGEMLAEGGEGRVHLLPRLPHLVYKAYHRPLPRGHLERLVDWPTHLPPERSAVLTAASAWPVAVVADRRDHPVGLLVPRAPRRFSIRHRDGQTRLASLSYLTAEPEHRAAAYGLTLPAAVTPERVGIVYALARLLEAFSSAEPAVAHGDLSTKNVLWSLQRGPEVFVIDCDNAECYEHDGTPVGEPGRRRAMTPNWNDPAVPRGANPTPGSDSYSLALVFLRVVGAANFPVQARQRSEESVVVRFAVPHGSAARRLASPGAPIWDLCARSLSLAEAASRPPASAWVAVLEETLASMGAAGLAARIRDTQGGGEPAAPWRPAGAPPADLAIEAVVEQRAAARSYRVALPPAGPTAPVQPAVARAPTSPVVAAVVTPARRAAAATSAGAVTSSAGAVTSSAGAVTSSSGSPGIRWAPTTTARPGRPNPASAQPSARAGVAFPVRPPAGATGAGRTGGPTRPTSRAAGPAPVAPGPGAPGPVAPPHGSRPSVAAASGRSTTGPDWRVETRAQLRRFAGWWLGRHRRAARSLRTAGRRAAGVRQALSCLLIDLFLLLLLASAVALVVSPIVRS